MKNNNMEQHYKAPLYTHSSPTPGLLQIIPVLSYWKGFPNMSPANNKGDCDDQRQEITSLYVMPKYSRTSVQKTCTSTAKGCKFIGREEQANKTSPLKCTK